MKGFVMYISVILVFVVTLYSYDSIAKSTLKKKQDPYLWLEEVEGLRALDFVKTNNEKTLNVLKADPHFKGLEADIRKIYFAQDRVPTVYQMNGMLYNFWQDQEHVRGIWRRTDLKSYKTANPKWELILDIDDLAKKEGENWVWKAANCYPLNQDKCLISLSRGGKDAKVVREFDLSAKKFVSDGFIIPESKSRASWIDENTLYIGVDSGPESMTDSGYPRTVKIWKRDQKLEEARLVFEGEKKDVAVSSYVNFYDGKLIPVFTRALTFYEEESRFVHADGSMTKIIMPTDAESKGTFKDFFLFLLRSDLKAGEKIFKTGSLVALPLKSVIAEDKTFKDLELVFEPTEKRFLEDAAVTKNHILLEIKDNIQGKIVSATYKRPHEWTHDSIDLGDNGVASVISTEDEHDDFIASYTDFKTPATYYFGNAHNPEARLEVIKKSTARFDSSELVSEQKFAKSKDGTMIPYFIVHKKSLKFDGKNPTLLYGYGGFEVSMLPYYSGVLGKSWMEKGGVYVLANIRGGGEFGPAWHQAAVKENRQIVFDDFIAIAEDLIKEKITSPAHLGIQGGSNGGLLVGGTFIQRPDLFNAVLCEVPLLDMFRYHKLLAGASWMGEYGNPDEPAMRKIIGKYSPYQNVKAGKRYPEVFFLTSTKDDRVHPGHARKMMAKMKEHGYPLFYYENIEGGHGGNANLEQSILWSSLEYTYLWRKLK